MPKVSCNEFDAVFRKRFPNVEKARKTGPELEREITAMRVAAEDFLGKTDKSGRLNPHCLHREGTGPSETSDGRNNHEQLLQIL